LAAVVRVPDTAGSGREMHGRGVERRRRQAPGDRVDPYLSGEGLGRSFGSRWFGGVFDDLFLLGCYRELGSSVDGTD
jgi:hypothetical protein